MFIPFEAGYLSALEVDPDLGEKSYKNKLKLVQEILWLSLKLRNY